MLLQSRFSLMLLFTFNHFSQSNLQVRYKASSMSKSGRRHLKQSAMMSLFHETKKLSKQFTAHITIA